jgi:hypothetical protein
MLSFASFAKNYQGSYFGYSIDSQKELMRLKQNGKPYIITMQEIPSYSKLLPPIFIFYFLARLIFF